MGADTLGAGREALGLDFVDLVGVETAMQLHLWALARAEAIGGAADGCLRDAMAGADQRAVSGAALVAERLVDDLADGAVDIDAVDGDGDSLGWQRQVEEWVAGGFDLKGTGVVERRHRRGGVAGGRRCVEGVVVW